MASQYYNYSGNFIPGTLARAESVSAEFSSVATGFSKLSIQGVDTGAVNAYVVTTTGYPVAAYQDGNNIQFEAIHTNTGPSTVNVNGIGPVQLLRFNGNALVSGDVVAGAWYTCIYTVLYGGFVIVSPTAYATFAGTISLAPPTNKVGLTASGGASTAAAPIDATWAIDQAIIPTWTGLHTFNGKVVVGAPASGIALTVTGVAGASAAQFLTTGVQVGAPTGGDKGAGSINVSGGFYINNVSVTAGTTVSSITGTANQIAASASTGAVTLSLPQNVIIPTPASGVALTVTGVSGASAAQFLTTGVQIGSPTGGDKGSGTLNVASNLYINNVAVVAGTGAGTTITGTANQIAVSASTGAVTLSLPQNVIIPTPASGVALTVTGVANTFAAQINASSTSGQSFGLFVVAGTTSADTAFKVANQANTIAYAQVSGNGSGFLGYNGSVSTITFAAAGNVAVAAPSSGVALTVTGVAGSSAAQFLTTGVQVGSPTGGDKGAGTINVASNFYINGTAISTGGVTSITGTANQIAASASTGAVTLSLPVNVVIPAVSSGIALSVSSSTNTTAAVSVSSSGTGAIGIQVDSSNVNVGAIVVLSNSTTIFGSIESGKANSITGTLGDMCVVAKTNDLVFAISTTPRMTVKSTGGVIVGAATDQGAGTLAALTQLYVGTTPMYRTGTFTGTLTGMTAGTTGTVTYSIAGTSCTLYGNFTGTSNSTAMTMTGLPAVCQPATLGPFVACAVEDNTNLVVGAASFAAGSGTVTFYRDVLATGALTAAGFTAAGAKGLVSWTVTYSLL